MIDYSGSSKLLQKELSFLMSIGYNKKKVTTESSKLTGDSLLITYESSKSGRKIEISFLRAQHDLPSSISVFLFANQNDSFSLEDWLNMKGKKQSIKLVSDMSSNQSENDFLSQFAISFENLCRGDLRDIVNGNYWESVPFDWKGYR